MTCLMLAADNAFSTDTLCRSTTLELQHVIISGCSKQAIMLKGPGAVLKASSVTFWGNGPVDPATAQAQPLGLVLSATEAVVEFTDVTLTGNNGVRFSRGAAVPLWRPFLHPACKDASVSGGVKGWVASSNSTSTDEDSVFLQHAGQQPCGSPLLASSLIDLEQSTLVLRGCRLQHNAADALITARGSSRHSLQLLPGTRLESNQARWLIVADSWTHDPIGRKNMKAPQPSEAVKGLDMEPPYTSYGLMGKIRSPDFWADEAYGEEAGQGRRLLQGQQQPLEPEEDQQEQQEVLQEHQQQSPALQQEQQLGPGQQLLQQPPNQQPQERRRQQQQQQQQQQQRQQHKGLTVPLPQQQQLAAQQQQQQQLQQLGEQQEPEQMTVSPDSVVGQAPKGQVGAA
jgi:hypothetical protein